MLSALSLVEIRWGFERLGAFAKPNFLSVECMKKRSNAWKLEAVFRNVYFIMMSSALLHRYRIQNSYQFSCHSLPMKMSSY